MPMGWTVASRRNFALVFVLASTQSDRIHIEPMRIMVARRKTIEAVDSSPRPAGCRVEALGSFECHRRSKGRGAEEKRKAGRSQQKCFGKEHPRVLHSSERGDEKTG